MDAVNLSIDNSGVAEPLQTQLLQILNERNLSQQRDRIISIVNSQNISMLDCAAALLFLSQHPVVSAAKPLGHTPKKDAVNVNVKQRSVRYRLNVGSQHNVDKQQIQSVLIEESGVDLKRIGKIDIRENYTLVELPEGMPADIFQLLFDATIGENKLAIKRIRPNKKIARNKGGS